MTINYFLYSLDHQNYVSHYIDISYLLGSWLPPLPQWAKFWKFHSRAKLAPVSITFCRKPHQNIENGKKWRGWGVRYFSATLYKKETRIQWLFLVCGETFWKQFLHSYTNTKYLLVWLWIHFFARPHCTIKMFIR